MSVRRRATWQPARTLTAALAALQVRLGGVRGWGWGGVERGRNGMAWFRGIAGHLASTDGSGSALCKPAALLALRSCRCIPPASSHPPLPTCPGPHPPCYMHYTAAGNESHAGQVFTCVAALHIAGRLELVDRDLLGWWCVPAGDWGRGPGCRQGASREGRRLASRQLVCIRVRACVLLPAP